MTSEMPCCAVGFVCECFIDPRPFSPALNIVLRLSSRKTFLSVTESGVQFTDEKCVYNHCRGLGKKYLNLKLQLYFSTPP